MSRKFTANPSTFPNSIHDTSDLQEMDLGTLVISDAGECFRYVKAGGSALVAGQLQQAPALVENHTNIAVASAASVGDETVTVTLGATAATADQYAGGVLVINDADGQGFTYRIKSHPAADASDPLELTLADDLQEALTTSSEASLVPDSYNGVIVHPTTATNQAVGVAVSDIPAGEYGWVQTRGPVSALNQGGTTQGLGLAASGTTAGAVATVAATTHQVGIAIAAGVDTEYNPIFIELE